jgi:hypothetical protein
VIRLGIQLCQCYAGCWYDRMWVVFKVFVPVYLVVTRLVTVWRFPISLLSQLIRDRFYYLFTYLPYR